MVVALITGVDTVIQFFNFTQVSFGRSKVDGYTGQNGLFGRFNRTIAFFWEKFWECDLLRHVNKQAGTALQSRTLRCWCSRMTSLSLFSVA